VIRVSDREGGVWLLLLLPIIQLLYGNTKAMQGSVEQQQTYTVIGRSNLCA
jgi:hypothetical protein